MEAIRTSMESVLIDDVRDFYASTEEPLKISVDGVEGVVYTVSKPMNYQRPYFKLRSRIRMCWEILRCHAFAVHYSEDERQLGEVPMVIKRKIAELKESKEK